MWGDPLVTRYINGGKPSSRSDSWNRFLRIPGHWQLMGFGYWIAVETESQKYVGEIGAADFKRDVTPSLENTAELGWVLAPHAHGKGFATEAIRAVIAWAEKNIKREKFSCLIDPQNEGSLRVARKVGFGEPVAGQFLGGTTFVLFRPFSRQRV